MTEEKIKIQQEKSEKESCLEVPLEKGRLGVSNTDQLKHSPSENFFEEKMPLIQRIYLKYFGRKFKCIGCGKQFNSVSSLGGHRKYCKSDLK